jgi:putative ABC transport system ATP-binding protein
MTRTRTAAIALPRQRTANQQLAAELRYVTLATHRRHKHQLVLDNVNLEIQRGEVTTVLSRRDTAASALLDILDGRVEPSWGSVRVAGREVTRLAHHELSRLKHEHIARVLPAYGVHARLTVRQNLVVAQRRSGRSQDLEWIDQVAEFMGLHGMLGYRQSDGADVRRARWAVARAMILRPSLVLVNDITAGLDRGDEQELLAALTVAADRLGAGVVLATRDPVTASRTDRVLLLNQGRVVDDTAAA